ncbi:hypothetical protein AB6A40_002011 [Gnathostoma spinigerum]|uniref:Uncharacterized protein n=1 Tax=Gnathostoma spinigerum TaxID=75299 RepID=A0ABD6EF51_9BILA
MICSQVKEVTEAEGTVSGTLLVTPNCLMFDPDVTHPLVRENGQESYMMMAPMEDITSVAVYKDIGVITGEIQKTDKMYDPQHVRTPVESKDITNSFFEENTHLKENLTNAASDISNNECNSRIKLEEPVNFGLGSSFDGASDASNLPLENDDESVVVCPKPIRSESQSSADSHVPLIGLGSASSTANISSINQDDEMFSTDAKG